MKKIVQGTASVLIAAGMVFGSTLVASAEEGTDAPITEIQQVEEAVVQEETPVVQEEEVVPEEETAPVEEYTEPPAEEPVVVIPPKTEEPNPNLPVKTVNTKTIKWILPNGGTPENVTWDQAEFNSELVPCGTSVWLQVDTYPYTSQGDKIRTDALNDDGFLRNGEDHGWVISWTWEKYTAKDCVVIPAKPENKIEYRDASSLNCEADLVTTTKEARLNEPVYNAETNTWVDGAWTDWTLVESTVRPATDEECPVVVPPTEEPPVVVPPVVEPPVVVPPVSTGQVLAVSDDRPAQLAETGYEGANMLPVVIGVGGVLLLGAGFLIWGLRREEKLKLEGKR